MDNATIGQNGENVAARYLENKGHKIIERNKFLKISEIDILSTKADTLYVTEVKTSLASHKTLQRPEERVSKSKRHKLRRATSLLLESYKDYDLSFCIISVTIQESPKRVWVSFMEDILLE